MNVLNPLTGSILQSTQVQRHQADDKDQQMRRLRELSRNVAARDDEYQHTVESSEELTPIHDQDAQQQPKRQKPAKHQRPAINSAKPTDHIDLTA